MNEIPTETKILIIEKNKNQINNSIYDLVIQDRVAKKVGDKELSKNLITQLNKLEKMKDEYQVVLRELKKDNKSK